MIRLRVADGTLNELVPREDPEWDPNTARGHQALKGYQELLIEGVRTGIPKTALLREQDDIELKITPHLNPAEFLRSEREEGELVHDWVEIIEQVYASREDLKDAPIDSPDWELFTDGSSFVENGTRYAGYAVVTTLQVIEAKALPPGTSAQKAEIRALT
ncbi:hypothetical protein DUI87_28647 [Hirundo rustica rustica]|uniref:RNase H type-1 domain-containing protein n=1 Tax=Hirundo rustica rustica TaxID=333673 RepID=A0A3M0J7I9_HIRRU|nr:hypothetical protein DUI87_28647 [Hirundo rustica rustica]